MHKHPAHRGSGGLAIAALALVAFLLLLASWAGLGATLADAVGP